MGLSVVFKGPDSAPGDDEPGRLTTKRRLVAGQACRWCGGRLTSELRGKPMSATLFCKRCDSPIGGDNTMLKVDNDSLDRFLEDWWKNA